MGAVLKPLNECGALKERTVREREEEVLEGHGDEIGRGGRKQEGGRSVVYKTRAKRTVLVPALVPLPCQSTAAFAAARPHVFIQSPAPHGRGAMRAPIHSPALPVHLSHAPPQHLLFRTPTRAMVLHLATIVLSNKSLFARYYAHSCLSKKPPPLF